MPNLSELSEMIEEEEEEETVISLSFLVSSFSHLKKNSWTYCWFCFLLFKE